MYSVVLLMAVTAGGESADLGRGCRGCNGCFSGCFGGGGYGCYSACNGCRGGGLFRGGRKCHGCNGCYSYGCHGGYMGHGCHGGYAHCGGMVIIGGHGCTGMKPATDGTGTKSKVEKKDKQGGEGGEGGKGDKGTGDKDKTDGVSTGPAPATLVVSLPASATLTFDGHRTTQTTAVRTFVTPALQPGRSYAYTLRAEFDRDGQRVEVNRRVEIGAGRTIRVDLNGGTAVAAR